MDSINWHAWSSWWISIRRSRDEAIHRIALAAQHQASEMFMDQVNAHTEAGLTFRNYSDEERFANINGLHAVAIIFENDLSNIS